MKGVGIVFIILSILLFSQEARASEEFVLPLSIQDTIITARFDHNTNPGQYSKGAYDNHKGTDYGAATGTPVIASADGKIIKVDSNLQDNEWKPRSLGNQITIQHSNGIQTIYAHLQRYNISVNMGDIVKQGQMIATSDNNGTSEGAHLHFEVKVNGAAIDPYTHPLLWKDKNPRVAEKLSDDSSFNINNNINKWNGEYYHLFERPDREFNLEVPETESRSEEELEYYVHYSEPLPLEQIKKEGIEKLKKINPPDVESTSIKTSWTLWQIFDKSRLVRATKNIFNKSTQGFSYKETLRWVRNEANIRNGKDWILFRNKLQHSFAQTFFKEKVHFIKKLEIKKLDSWLKEKEIILNREVKKQFFKLVKHPKLLKSKVYFTNSPRRESIINYLEKTLRQNKGFTILKSKPLYFPKLFAFASASLALISSWGLGMRGKDVFVHSKNIFLQRNNLSQKTFTYEAQPSLIMSFLSGFCYSAAALSFLGSLFYKPLAILGLPLAGLGWIFQKISFWFYKPG